MSHALKLLIGSALQAEERRVTLREAFFHPEDGRLRYVALDIGGWLSIDEVLVQAGFIAPPEAPGQPWQLLLSERELARAPAWDDGARPEMADAASWPPVIVGPFGNAFSPMMVHRRMEQAGPAEARASRTGGLVERLHKAGVWLGLPVFDSQGQIGEIRDMWLDTDPLRIVALEVGPAGLFGGGTRRVPFAAIRHVAEQGTHLVVDPDVVSDPVP